MVKNVLNKNLWNLDASCDACTDNHHLNLKPAFDFTEHYSEYKFSGSAVWDQKILTTHTLLF